MRPTGCRRWLLAATACVLVLPAIAGCSNMPGPAATEKERRINVGADPKTVTGKQARGLMDSGLVPAPTGVTTGFEGGLNRGRPGTR